MVRGSEFYSKISDRPRLHGKKHGGYEFEPGFVYLPVGKVKASVEWMHKAAPQSLKDAIGAVRGVAKDPFSFFRKSTEHSGRGGKNTVLSIPRWDVPNFGGGHGRSVKLVSRFELDGKQVEALDIKGTGPSELKARPEKPDDWGTFDVRRAADDASYAQTFHELGLKVALPVAILRLHEIYDNNGKRVSVGEARKKGLVLPGRQPSLFLRAVESPMRWNDANKEDALRFFNEHRKQYGWANITDYAAWVARNVGKSLAVIRNNGLHFCFSHGGNVTLAGELVDFDGVVSKETADKSPEEHYSRFGEDNADFLRELISATSKERDVNDHSRGALDEFSHHFERVQRAFVEGYVYNRDKKGWFSEFDNMYHYGQMGLIVSSIAPHCLPPDKKDWEIPAITGLPRLANIFERRGRPNKP